MLHGIADVGKELETELATKLSLFFLHKTDKVLRLLCQLTYYAISLECHVAFPNSKLTSPYSRRGVSVIATTQEILA